VVQKMCEVARSLGYVVAPMPCTLPIACRHRLRRKDDPQKQFVVTCMAFEVPTL
jgi:hypothetical protein